ncbi:MAG TPA: OB-fold nucleic acid binding domain-containing protein, partial [Acidimicrobiia bacterium]|nr:OB-fold nucleic acid binding domain-containing protein [Acidimicrobiia bacterium]
PDVNTSQMDFSVFDGAIRFGLSAVRNVGEGAVQRIIEERMAGEPFAHFQDFIDRVDPMVLNKRTIESLIKAGAFDGMGHSRRSLVLVYEQWLEATLVRRRNEEMGQYTLFGGDAPEVGEVVLALPGGEWDQKVKLGFEREMLGLYISDHPLLTVGTSLRRAATLGVPELWEQPDGASVTIGGMVGAINRRFTRNGEAMLFFQCEDLEGSVEVVAFPKVAAEAIGVIREDAIVVVTGRLDHRGDDIKVVAREIKELEVRNADEVRLEVPAAALSPRAVGRLKEILGNHPGTSPVFLHMVANGNHKVLRLGDEHRVEPRSALYAELRELFGAGAIV